MASAPVVQSSGFFTVLPPGLGSSLGLASSGAGCLARRGVLGVGCSPNVPGGRALHGGADSRGAEDRTEAGFGAFLRDEMARTREAAALAGLSAG